MSCHNLYAYKLNSYNSISFAFLILTDIFYVEPSVASDIVAYCVTVPGYGMLSWSDLTEQLNM